MPNNQFKKGELYSFITGKASTAIARRLQKNFKQSNVDITIEQWSVLYHLWKEDGLSQQQLCDATFRDKPSITRLVSSSVSIFPASYQPATSITLILAPWSIMYWNAEVRNEAPRALLRTESRGARAADV